MKIQRSIPLRNTQMFSRRFLHYKFANMKFWQQTIIGDFCKLRKDSTVSLRIESTTFVLIDSLGFHYGTSVLYSCTSMLKFPYLQRGLIIDQIWRKRIFSKIVPVFRKYLSVSRWNLPGNFRVSFWFPQVTEFGKSTANRRRSTWPILFVSITQPCNQHDRMIRTIRKSAARWRGRRARGYRKLILHVNLLYVPNIKM